MNKSKQYAEISNLNEYIACITKHNLEGFISRGENNKFDSITASAFRNQLPIKFQDMISEFYNIIGNTITNMQQDNFIAFSQHHGIPTNLIDFSTSPLVSLFFACYDVDKIYDSGYVYFIDNNKLINVNDIIQHSDYKSNLFQQLLQFDSTIYPIITKLYIYEHTHIHEVEQIIIDWSNKLKLHPIVKKKYRHVLHKVKEFTKSIKSNNAYSLSEYSQIILNELNKANIEDMGCTTDFILWDDYIDKFNNLLKYMIDDFQYNYYNDILLILILIKVVFGELYDYTWTKERLLKNFNLPFYFTYYPPNILSRIVNQSSLFIYQLYYDDSITDPYVDKVENRITQAILPDFTIKINNKEEIIKSLDTMGINLKFIYNDYDNIAKYIKRKP